MDIFQIDDKAQIKTNKEEQSTKEGANKSIEGREAVSETKLKEPTDVTVDAQTTADEKKTEDK